MRYSINSLASQRSYTITSADVEKSDPNSLTQRVSQLFNFDEETTRISSGEAIVFQNEISSVFLELIEEPGFIEYSYLKSIILEYIRWLKEFNLPTQPKLAGILWKLMWRN